MADDLDPWEGLTVCIHGNRPILDGCPGCNGGSRVPQRPAGDDWQDRRG